MNSEKKIINKKLIIPISAILILFIAAGVFVIIMYTSLFDHSIPIVEREDEYIVDYTPPEGIYPLSAENEPDEIDIMPETDPETEPEPERDPLEPDPDLISEENPDLGKNPDSGEKPEPGKNTTNKNSSISTGVSNSPAKQVPIYKIEQINKDVINILLLGSDSRDPKKDRGRSDSMMVMSYNKTKNTVTLLSLLRDSLIPIEGYDWNRINTTYFYGGVGLAINTINDLFGLDIQSYAIINFEGFVNIVDKIGGVEVNLTGAEAEYYNQNFGSKFKKGINTLNGAEALAHSRNRTSGGEADFGRTRRQRETLMAIYEKCIKLKDFTVISSLIGFALDNILTNVSPDVIYSAAKDLLSGNAPEIKTAQMPFLDTYKFVWYKKMAVIQIDIKENRKMIQELLY